MSLMSRFMAWRYKLPSAISYRVTHVRDLPVAMPDGAVLLADHYFPAKSKSLPTVLIRSPYGRRNVLFDAIARLFAERGYQVLVQSCRGTFGSGGKFFPFMDDRLDGLTTIAWLKQQPWFSGEFAMFGPSYLSYVQWAVGDQAGPELKALLPIVTAADFRTVISPGGSFALDTTLNFSQGITYQEDPPLKTALSRSKLASSMAKALMHLPIKDADHVAAGKTVDFYQEWLAHASSADPWWDSMDHRAAVSQVKAPVHLVGGFYDVLFPTTLDCYRLLHEAGRNPFLTIGPWSHGSADMTPVWLNESLKWFGAHLKNDRSGLRQAPVRLYIMGKNQWKDFAAWPPEGYKPQAWYLQPGGGLSPSMPSESEPDCYRYDPADPTPAIGGTSLVANTSGPKDNRKLEQRKDVLVYSSAPLEHDLEVIGSLRVTLYVKSSLQCTDFFARLCDVAPSGKSINLSDGIVRLSPGHFEATADGVQKVEIELWPTACCFVKGHRIRVQVSSGSHPRYVRNLGSGEQLATGTRLIPADQQVFHDPVHPSAIILPATVTVVQSEAES
jgi:uncharacterized protein